MPPSIAERSRAARVRSMAFLLLSVTLALDLIVTLIGSWHQLDSRTIGLVTEYAIFILGAYFTSRRLLIGKGVIIGLCTLMLLLVETSLVFILIIVVGGSGYHAPWYVYVAHIMYGAAFIAAWPALISAMWNWNWTPAR